MPELPEVEVVRRGLVPHIQQCTIDSVEVLHPRAVRGMAGGAAELQAQLEGAIITTVARRGKFLWLELAEHAVGEPAVVVHLGMSGQMLVKETAGADSKHLRIRTLLSNDKELWFVDQRTFGYWLSTELVDVGRGIVPATVSHIARDLLDPVIDLDEVVARLKTRDLEIKKLLLNQEVVAGIGNIYADEMLWAAGIHPNHKAKRISCDQLKQLLMAGQDVMRRALEQGGTSFDELYVNVNGQSGYFAVSLNAYGQTGKPCLRCGREIVRIKFTNRSSHLCPNCQRVG